jgi:tRNA (adenine37-N6)-methyltransferase
MPENRELTLRPIGRVVEGRPPSQRRVPWEGESVLEIKAVWAEGLEGLDGFSHVWVLWWLDRSPEGPPELRVHPERRSELPLVGLFATRSPLRPNPVALTAVQLLAVEGRRLRVKGLDAFEGTPILDIKPYLRRGDLWPEASMPAWIDRLWQVHDQERGAAGGTQPGRDGEVMA